MIAVTVAFGLAVFGALALGTMFALSGRHHEAEEYRPAPGVHVVAATYAGALAAARAGAVLDSAGLRAALRLQGADGMRVWEIGCDEVGRG